MHLGLRNKIQFVASENVDLMRYIQDIRFIFKYDKMVAILSLTTSFYKRILDFAETVTAFSVKVSIKNVKKM